MVLVQTIFNRGEEAVEKFFRQIFENEHCEQPRVIGVDKHVSYPPAFNTMKTESLISENSEQRFQNFKTADATISGHESMHILKKGQIENIGGNDIVS